MDYANRHNIGVGIPESRAYQKARAAIKRAIPRHVERTIMFEILGCQDGFT